jgi:hypothetical protein
MRHVFNLEDIRHQIRAGALVLFTGLSVYSYTVEALTNSKYSHCALVVYPNQGGKTIITESSGKGVCLSKLDDYITYNNNRSIYIINPSFDVRPEQIIDVYSKYANKPYSYNPLNLLSAVFKRSLYTVDYNSFFCSEYVMVLLSDLNICILSKPSNEYSPQDISMLELYDDNVIDINVPYIGFFRRIYEFFVLY